MRGTVKLLKFSRFFASTALVFLLLFKSMFAFAEELGVEVEVEAGAEEEVVEEVEVIEEEVVEEEVEVVEEEVSEEEEVVEEKVESVSVEPEVEVVEEEPEAVEEEEGAEREAVEEEVEVEEVVEEEELNKKERNPSEKAAGRALLNSVDREVKRVVKKEEAREREFSQGKVKFTRVNDYIDIGKIESTQETVLNIYQYPRRVKNMRTFNARDGLGLTADFELRGDLVLMPGGMEVGERIVEPTYNGKDELEVDGESVLRYNDVYPGVDIVFEKGDVMAKKIVIDEPLERDEGDLVFWESYDLPRGARVLGPSGRELNGVEEFNVGGFKIISEDGIEVNVSGATVFDSLVNADDALEERGLVLKHITEVDRWKNEFRVGLVVPEEYLERRDLVYPLVVDPTYYICSDVGIFDDIGDCNLSDLYLRGTDSNSVMAGASSNYLWLGKNSSRSYQPLLKFMGNDPDFFEGLDSYGELTGARLYMYYSSIQPTGSFNGDYPTRAKKVTTSWSPSNVVYGTPGSSTGINDNLENIDSFSSYREIPTTASEGDLFYWSVTSAVYDWISGDTNNGILIQGDPDWTSGSNSPWEDKTFKFWANESSALYGPYLQLTFSVLGDPDLTYAADDISPTSVSPGETINFDWRVKNAGVGPNGNGGDIYYYFNDFVSYNNSYRVGTDSFQPMGANGSTNESFNYTVPSNTPPGTYYFYFWIDANGDVEESNENNNRKVYTITVEGADVEALDLEFVNTSNNYYPNDILQLDATVRNNGNDTLNTVYYAVELINVSTLERTNLNLWANSFDSLNLDQNEQTTRRFTGDIPSDIEQGAYHAEITLDYNNQIAESNEFNNDITTAGVPINIIVGGAPGGDNDSDGYTNAEESYSGTNTDQPDSQPIFDTNYGSYMTELPDQFAYSYGGDPVNLRTGAFEFTQTDFELPSSGMPISFTRTYNSALNDRGGRFGRGWSSSYNSYYYKDPSSGDVQVYLGGSLAALFTTSDGGQTYDAPRGNFDSFYLEGGEFVYETIDGVRYKFLEEVTPNLKALSEIRDQYDEVITLQYQDVNDVPLLIQIVDGVRRLEFTYGDSNDPVRWDKVVSMDHNAENSPHDFSSRAISFEYDDDGYLTKVSQNRHFQNVQEVTIEHQFTYDDNGQLYEYIDPRGGVLTNTYKSSGEVSTQWYTKVGDIRRPVYEFDYEQIHPNAPAGTDKCTMVENYRGAGNVPFTWACFDADGLKIFDADGEDAFETWTYYSSGMPSSYTDKNGETYTYQYDSRRRKILEVLPDADGWQTEIAYEYENNFNRVTKKTKTGTKSGEPTLVQVTNYTVDPSDGDLLEIEYPDGEREVFTYDDYGNVITKTDRNGNVENFFYDSGSDFLYRINKPMTDPDGGSYSYDVYYLTNSLGEVVYEEVGSSVVSWKRRGFDSNGNLVTYETDVVDTSISYYDLEDNRTAQLGPSDLSMTFEYDGDLYGSMTGTTINGDPAPISTSSEYDRLGNLEREYDELGRVTRYIYDGADRVIERREPLLTTYFEYDGNGNLVVERDNEGGRTEFAYDERNNLIEKRTFVDAAQFLTETFEYDGLNRLVRETDGNNNAWLYEYDVMDRLVRETDPEGGVTEYFYDANGNRSGVLFPRAQADVSLRNAFGHSITYEYDEMDQLVKTTNANDKVTLTFYDLNGNVRRVVDRQNVDGTLNEHTVNYNYDSEGRLLDRFGPDGGELRYQFNGRGQLRSLTDEEDRVTEYFYDDFDRLSEERAQGGASTFYSYDDAGNVTRIDYPDGKSVTYGYDDHDNRTSVTDHFGNQRLFTYDGRSNQLSERDKRGYFTTFVYDEIDRLTQETNPQSAITSYQYDGNSNVVEERVSDGGQARVTTYVYDGLDRVESITHPGGRLEQFDYDSEGNIVASRNGDSEQITYTYDSLNRRVASDYPDKSDRSYAYDNWGNLVNSFGEAGSYSATFNYENELELISYGLGSFPVVDVFKTFDKDGQLESITYPTGLKMNYLYDSRGNLASISENGVATPVVSYTYNLMDLPEFANYRNGVTADYVYDGLHRLVDIEVKNAADEVLVRHEYVFDAESNRTRLTENSDRVIDYTYDQLGQLTSVDYANVGGGAEISFSYDKFGNRLSASDQLGSTSYVYDNDSNELQSYTSGNYSAALSYDGDGAIDAVSFTRGGVGTGSVDYAWSSDGRLANTTFTKGDRPSYLPVIGAETVQYRYGHDDNRVRKIHPNGEVSYYVNDGLNVLNEIDNDGTIVNARIYGMGVVAEVDESGNFNYFHNDILGSPLVVTNEGGEVVSKYEYDAFGQLIGSEGSARTNYLFTGQEYDVESALHYYNDRYYDSALGRFISRDSFMGRVGDVVSKNRYAYVKNNPLKYVDPTGEEEKLATQGVLASARTFREKWDAQINYANKYEVSSGVTTMKFAPLPEKQRSKNFYRVGSFLTSGVQTLKAAIDVYGSYGSFKLGARTLPYGNGLVSAGLFGLSARSIDQSIINQANSINNMSRVFEGLPPEDFVQEGFLNNEDLDKFLDSVSLAKDIASPATKFSMKLGDRVGGFDKSLSFGQNAVSNSDLIFSDAAEITGKAIYGEVKGKTLSSVLDGLENALIDYFSPYPEYFFD